MPGATAAQRSEAAALDETPYFSNPARFLTLRGRKRRQAARTPRRFATVTLAHLGFGRPSRATPALTPALSPEEREKFTAPYVSTRSALRLSAAQNSPRQIER
jgi:hypothetical protein